MNIAFSTPLKGNLVLCRDLRDAEPIHRSDLYKFLWVRQGSLSLEVDHVPLRLAAGEIISLTPLHRLGNVRSDGECLSLLFDSNFYCIFGHDGEVSCNGLLFNGSSEPLRLVLSAERQEALGRIVDELCAEYEVDDGLREEMLRMQLKRFIIVCTRAAREHLGVDGPQEQLFDIVRRFYVLVDEHFRTRRRVQDYAELLHRSPKTLSNLFAACGRPSPLSVIHDRVNAEARRLLLYTDKSAKEVAYLLGYEDTAAFSRFFAKMNGESITDFRRRAQRE
ncbi:helix-turn-helix domain-containing protein [Alistipes sp. kh20]|uniref:AraC family transcriptional regulator n=1 Tax=Alistipes montrealensis TaxID=2834113 RepID=UPI001BD0D5D0|nr:AraC family transcriptional regulator [Alistipes montrealensis]MBS4764912.1 helix-turn-helix domain-containing protein [Alistipes montrealensis]